MDYKKLNEILSDLNRIRSKYPEVTKSIIKDIGYDGEQGESGLSYEVYKLPFEDLYIKLTINTDSYGDNEFVNGIQFVKPITKTITDFEEL